MAAHRGRWRPVRTNLLISAGTLVVMGLLLEAVIRLTGAAYDPQI